MSRFHPLWSCTSVTRLLWLEPFRCPPNTTTARAGQVESSAFTRKVDDIFSQPSSSTSSSSSSSSSSHCSLGEVLSHLQRPRVATSALHHSEPFPMTETDAAQKYCFYSVILKILHVALCKINVQQNRTQGQTSGNIAEGGQYKTQNPVVCKVMAYIRLCDKHNLLVIQWNTYGMPRGVRFPLIFSCPSTLSNHLQHVYTCLSPFGFFNTKLSVVRTKQWNENLECDASQSMLSYHQRLSTVVNKSCFFFVVVKTANHSCRL